MKKLKNVLIIVSMVCVLFMLTGCGVENSNDYITNVSFFQ